jgi:hypothetical protein
MHGQKWANTNDGENVWCFVGDVVDLFGTFGALRVTRNNIGWNAFKLLERESNDALCDIY